jgi:hypothetical protein
MVQESEDPGSVSFSSELVKNGDLQFFSLKIK